MIRQTTSLLQGFSSQTLVSGGLIVCALRSLGREHGIEMATLARKWDVAGFDVCGHEGQFPLHDDSCAMADGEGLTVRTRRHAHIVHFFVKGRNWP